jgi:hypothetical protein
MQPGGQRDRRADRPQTPIQPAAPPGVPLRLLRRLVTLESAVPLLAAGLFLQAQFSVSLHSPRTTYYLTVLGGLLISLAIIATTLPLLSRITGPETARHE